MSNRSQTTSAGFPILGLLGILFIGLKLTGHITWSWWWVLAPFWGGFAFVIVLMLIVAIVVAARGR